MPQANNARRFVIAVDPERAPEGLERGVFAIGNFDGAHLGHRAVVRRTRELAAELGAPGAVLTFEPHPADFFAGAPVVFRLTPQAVKARALEEFGLDGAVILTFDAGLAALTAEEFVRDVLVERLGVAAVVIGWDFHFGKRRGGSPAFMEEAGARYDFRVEVIPKIEAAVKAYPYARYGSYRVWPGPNSNTFTATILRAASEIDVHHAVIKQYLEV